MIFRRNTYSVKFKVSVVEWQCQNEASVHRPAKEFADDRNHAASGVNAMANWKDKPVERLENSAVYVVAKLWQSILTTEFLEGKRGKVRLVSNQLL